MKRKLFVTIAIILFTVLMFAGATIAFAADSETTADRGSFYTWGMLATYAGCLAATMIITQFLKPIWPQKIATQFLSYIIAVVILILANLFIGSLTWETAGISVLNAVVIALAANGAFNDIVEMRNKVMVKK